MKIQHHTDINKIYDFFFFFRTKRMKEFMLICQPTNQTHILDVGGTAYNWTIIDSESKITLLNLSVPSNSNAIPDNFSYTKGDGTNLQYQDNSFDICFSNSVIEHLGTYEKQILFAKEVQRVAKKIWIQTPAKAFFFEPHWLAPFIHYFPMRIQRKMAKHFTLRGRLSDQKYVDNLLAELRLLTFKEMKELFPDCEIRIERFLGMPKSYIAIRQ